MTLASKIRGSRVAVFTRNHRHYLEEAEAIALANPQELVVFRARAKWASAAEALSLARPLPLYVAPVGGDGTVEYVADLHEVHLEPDKGSPLTKELLGKAAPSTQAEGLWESSGKPVQTLYMISNCRKVASPFPMTALVKVSDDLAIDPNYGYSYSLVYALEPLVPEPEESA